MLKMLELAAKIALPTTHNDPRNFLLGCVGIRSDGTTVTGRNGAVEYSANDTNYQLVPSSHAEGRVLRKLGKYGTLYVARVLKRDGSLAMARPCMMCQTRIKSYKVEKVYYTIDPYHYGLFLPQLGIDKIYNV